MKIRNLLSALTATALVTFSLAAHGMGFLVKPAGVTYVPFTNYVVNVITNSAGVPVLTNAVPVVQAVPQTNFVVNPMIQTGATLVRTYAPLLPPPFGDFAALGATAVTGLLGLLLRAKNGQLKSTADKLGVAQTIVGAVVQGVEAAGDNTTKASIQSHATAAGVQDDLHDVVQGMTVAPVGPILRPQAAAPK